MTGLRIVLGLILSFILGAHMSDVDDKGDLCYTCSCSADDTVVDCSWRGLTDVPSGYSNKVLELNMSYNDISSFPNLKRFPKLMTLDLSGNKLSVLPENALNKLTALEVLNLSHNYYDNWINLNPNDAFQTATELKMLDLSYNKFKTMANLANQELIISPSIEILNLDGCQIKSIHGRSPLGGLINIKTLKLSNNPLQRIQSLISPTLKRLHVNNCDLSKIYHNELTFLPSLVYLEMSHNFRLELSSAQSSLVSNSLWYLDISFCNVQKPNLQGFPNLRRAVLNHNMIRTLGSNEFVNNTKLEQIDLSYNNIGSLKSDTFRGLDSLKWLDLSWNEIASIPEDSLIYMSSLTQINMSRNYFTKVGHLRSTSLTILDLSSCEINRIGKDSLEGLPSIIDLNLSHNLLAVIPDSLSSNSLRYLNLNYNRLSYITNFTFFMLPRLTVLSVIGNRFTNILKKSYFDSNPYLEGLDLDDNMWRCDCSDPSMYEFYEFVTLEPNKKEESYNLICHGPTESIGQTWLEACYFTWNPAAKPSSPDSLIWFIIVMIIGLSLTLVLVNVIRASMKRRLATMQAERERQVEEARDRLRQMRIRAEQEALCNTPDPRDLIAPPSYIEALSMPKLNLSCHSLNETGRTKSRKSRGRRKTKSSGDLLEETEQNGDVHLSVDIELTESPQNEKKRRRRRRKSVKYGSHEIADLDRSPGARRRRQSAYDENIDDSGEPSSVLIETEAELERPFRPSHRRYSSDDNEPRESDF